MNIDFGNTDGAVPVAAVELPSNRPAADISAPVKPSEAVAPAGLTGCGWRPTLKDIILPRINIVQGSGTLKNSFPFGALVFDRKLVLFAPPDIDAATGNIRRAGTPPLVLTVLEIHKTRFVEKVDGGGRGLIVDTEEQVRAAGGTLDYREWDLKKASGMKRFEYLADAIVAVERPAAIADDDTVFVYPIDGKKYTLAIWGLKGTAYTAACKRVFFHDVQMGCLRGLYARFSYNVTTRFESRNNNPYAVPVCIPHQKSTPAFLEFANSIVGSGGLPIETQNEE